jgi:hypothetical protein
VVFVPWRLKPEILSLLFLANYALRDLELFPKNGIAMDTYI